MRTSATEGGEGAHLYHSWRGTYDLEGSGSALSKKPIGYEKTMVYIQNVSLFGERCHYGYDYNIIVGTMKEPLYPSL